MKIVVSVAGVGVTRLDLGDTGSDGRAGLREVRAVGGDRFESRRSGSGTPSPQAPNRGPRRNSSSPIDTNRSEVSSLQTLHDWGGDCPQASTVISQEPTISSQVGEERNMTGDQGTASEHSFGRNCRSAVTRRCTQDIGRKKWPPLVNPTARLHFVVQATLRQDCSERLSEKV